MPVSNCKEVQWGFGMSEKLQFSARQNPDGRGRQTGAYQISYPAADDKGKFLTHPGAKSVVAMHNFGWMFAQATVAILILVGFESVTSMGGEAINPKRNVPIAVITSLLVQGAFCYLFEY